MSFVQHPDGRITVTSINDLANIYDNLAVEAGKNSAVADTHAGKLVESTKEATWSAAAKMARLTTIAAAAVIVAACGGGGSDYREPSASVQLAALDAQVAAGTMTLDDAKAAGMGLIFSNSFTAQQARAKIAKGARKTALQDDTCGGMDCGGDGGSGSGGGGSGGNGGGNGGFDGGGNGGTPFEDPNDPEPYVPPGWPGPYPPDPGSIPSTWLPNCSTSTYCSATPGSISSWVNYWMVKLRNYFSNDTQFVHGTTRGSIIGDMRKKAYTCAPAVGLLTLNPAAGSDTGTVCYGDTWVYIFPQPLQSPETTVGYHPAVVPPPAPAPTPAPADPPFDPCGLNGCGNGG